jgi:hypothetical protein
VLLGGKPVDDAVVRFESREMGVSSFSPVGPNGEFRMVSQYGAGLPVGTYRVTVEPPSIPEGLPGQRPVIPTTKVPKRYHLATTSGLTAEVKPDSGPFLFELNP